MYSSVNNHDKSNSILSFPELIGVIAVFAFLLYLLFPKGNIEDFLEEQGSNTNLSINYLQSMILYHPNNIQLKMMLIEKYTEISKEKEAISLNQELIENSQNKELLLALYKVDYLLHKALYFQKATAPKLKALKARLLKLYQYAKGQRDYLFFFGESTNIDYSYLKYHSLEHFMAENPELIDYELEKMAFDLANQLGYKKEAYSYLQHLIKYPQITEKLSEYLIYSLFEHGEFRKAKEITTQLFLESQSEDELTKYFHLALYALVQDKTKNPIEVSQLIQDYANLKTLRSADIVIILNTLLELGDSKEASNFAINMFYANPERFDETGIDLALQSLLYHSELEQARAISFFAKNKFKRQKYLDKTILLSTWLGDIEAVSALNKEGYYHYQHHNKIYEEYFLNNENLDYNHAVLGDIYKKKIQQGEEKYLDNLARYFDYTGEINQAEAYFIQLVNKGKNKRAKKKATYYAIEFAHKNSHFKEGLALYKTYVANYGIDPKLHELSIQKSLAIKAFEQAYALTKSLPKKDFLLHKQRFMDLAWLEKDYAYVYQQLWNFERQNKITANDFEHFILLEKELNQSKKIKYLYKQAWKKTANSYHLTALMYQLLQDKNLDTFYKTLKTLSAKEKSKINNNIDFQTLLANYYMEQSNIPLALQHYDKIFELAPNKVTSHQSYLWFLLDNKLKHPKLHQKIMQELSYLEKHSELRKKVGLVAIIAGMGSKKQKVAHYWLKQEIAKDPNNKAYQRLNKDLKRVEQEQLYAQYDKMLNQGYLDSEVTLKEKHLSPKLSMNEMSFSHQWKLYQNIKSKLSLTHYQYHSKKSQSNKQTAFEIAIKNSKKRFLWDFHLAQVLAEKDFLSTSLELGYSTEHLSINIEGKYQNKTQLTPQLEKNAVENALALQLQLSINPQTSVSMLAQERTFKDLNGLDLGEARQIQISTNHVLRLGYPDISFNTYVSHNQFSNNIAHDFSEFGISTSIGSTRQNTINSSWKPFGTLSLAVNDAGNIGSSLVMGVSKSLKGNDSFDVLFNYYNGIGVISEPIYGLNLKYRF